MNTDPLRLAVINDHELVLAGLREMLRPYEHRVRVVELDSNTETVTPVDVALYDTYAMGALNSTRFASTAANPHIRRLAVYAWNVDQTLVDACLEAGAKGVLSKRLPARELVESLERVHAGQVVTTVDEEPDAPISDGNWPGRAEGLTGRQSEVISLITQGYSNAEIAEATYLSINSVKSYIRAAYRTMGVTNRTQAILWGIDHGFDQKRRRTIPHAGDLG